MVGASTGLPPFGHYECLITVPVGEGVRGRGIGNISVILGPADIRTRKLPLDMPAVPEWATGLYQSIKTESMKATGE